MTALALLLIAAATTPAPADTLRSDSAAVMLQPAQTDLTVRLPAAFGSPAERLAPSQVRDGPEAWAVGSTGFAASIGSAVGAFGGVVTSLVIGMATNQTLAPPSTPVLAGLVVAGSVAGATAGVAMLGRPTPPSFAGFPTGPNPVRPDDWRPALVGIALATPVGLALGAGAGRVTGGPDGTLIGMMAAVPLAQGIGAGLAVLRSRRAERRAAQRRAARR